METYTICVGCDKPMGILLRHVQRCVAEGLDSFEVRAMGGLRAAHAPERRAHAPLREQLPARQVRHDREVRCG